MGHKLKCREVAVMEGVTIRTINVRCKEIPPYYPTATCIARRWYIDSDDPKLGSEKMTITPEITNTNEVKNDIKPPEIKVNQPETQTVKDETAKIQAENLKINAEILRDEAQGRRDKPAKLAEREVSLNNRETTISNKEASLANLVTEMSARLLDLETKEKEIIARKKEADTYYSVRAKEGDTLYNSKKRQSELMEFTLNGLQDQINKADAKIAAYPDKLNPIYAELDQLVKVSNQWGMHYYKKAQNTEMQESQNHSRRSNKFFDLGDAFSKLKDWLRA
jgi:hypothetical protein